MAASDSNLAEIQESLADITECCICTETYKEPKVLPCVHTFCLRCLQETGQRLNATPGDKMPCPVCRKEFTVPDDGFSGLQKNFFMERLIDVTKSLNPTIANVLLCDACKEDDSTTDVPLAEHFCLECYQNLCKECHKYHIKNKMTKTHRVLPLDKEQQSSVHLLPRMVPSLCSQHEGEMLKIYCKCCKMIVCALCFVEHHTGHSASDVGKLANDFKETLNKDIESLLAVKSESINKMSKLEEIKTGFIENRNMLQEEINRRRSELKDLICRHSDSLLLELNSVTQEKLKEIQTEREETEFELVSLDSFVKYCTELTVKGSASDICRAGESLKMRADELQKLRVFNRENELDAVRIRLQTSELEAFLLITAGTSSERSKMAWEQALYWYQLQFCHGGWAFSCLLCRTVCPHLAASNASASGRYLNDGIEPFKKPINEKVQPTMAGLNTEHNKTNSSNEKFAITFDTAKQGLVTSKETSAKHGVETTVNKSLQQETDKLRQDLEKEKLGNKKLYEKIDSLSKAMKMAESESRKWQTSMERQKQELKDKDRSLKKLKASHEERISKLTADGDRSLNELKASHEKHINRLTADGDRSLKKLEASYEERIGKLTADGKDAQMNWAEEERQLYNRIDDATREMTETEERADRLSEQRIVRAQSLMLQNQLWNELETNRDLKDRLRVTSPNETRIQRLLDNANKKAIELEEKCKALEHKAEMLNRLDPTGFWRTSLAEKRDVTCYSHLAKSAVIFFSWISSCFRWKRGPVDERLVDVMISQRPDGAAEAFQGMMFVLLASFVAFLFTSALACKFHRTLEVWNRGEYYCPPPNINFPRFVSVVLILLFIGVKLGKILGRNIFTKILRFLFFSLVLLFVFLLFCIPV